MEEFKISNIDLINLNQYARSNYCSLFEALKNVSQIKGISPETISQIDKLLRYHQQKLPQLLFRKEYSE